MTSVVAPYPWPHALPGLTGGATLHLCVSTYASSGLVDLEDRKKILHVLPKFSIFFSGSERAYRG